MEFTLRSFNVLIIYPYEIEDCNVLDPVSSRRALLQLRQGPAGTEKRREEPNTVIRNIYRRLAILSICIFFVDLVYDLKAVFLSYCRTFLGLCWHRGHVRHFRCAAYKTPSIHHTAGYPLRGYRDPLLRGNRMAHCDCVHCDVHHCGTLS